jgi:hypothetical protein
VSVYLSRRRGVLRAAELVLVLLLLAQALSTLGAAKAKQDGDEAEWIGTSTFFLTLFVHHDISPDAWPDSYWTRTQPMMPRYVLGAWLWARGYDLTAFNPNHNHLRNWDWNQKAGTAPSNADREEARRVMRGLAAVTVIAMYALVRFAVGTVGGIIGGAVAALLLLGSPYLTEHLVRAKGDTTLMFFWISAFATLVAGMRRLGGGQRAGLLLAVLGGALLGLAFGSKLTAALGILALALWTALATLDALWRARAATVDTAAARNPFEASPAADRSAGIVSRLLRPGERQRIAFGVLALSMAAVSFIASNPFLYPDPIWRTLLLFQNRRDEMAVQMATEPHRAVLTVQDRVWQTLDRSLYNEAWGPSYVGYSIEVVLAAIGAGWLALRAVRRRPGADALLLLAVICAFAGIAGGLGYRQQHYFVPTSMLGLALAGLAVGFTCQSVWLRVAAEFPALSAAPHRRAVQPLGADR